MGCIGLTIPRKQHQRAGETFLTGVEKLINEIFFDPDVPRQHVSQEPICECGCGV